MSRFPSSRNIPHPSAFVRVNGKIRAREVRVIGAEGSQLGVLPLNEALAMARNQGVDLVEIVPNATPPVCRLVDFGKYRYELSKKDKESKKHQHANKVKEVQLSPTIDPHDFAVKLGHAVDFLCEEMKVKITLKFRGREMAHQEFGFQTVNNFIKELLPYAHPDAPPKLLGRGINVMLSPLPRNKRAKNPNPATASSATGDASAQGNNPPPGVGSANHNSANLPRPSPAPSPANPLFPSTHDNAEVAANEFANNPFAQLDVKIPT